MQLVIDISEEDYNYVKKQVAEGITNPLKICIANGTPKQKMGHWINNQNGTFECDQCGCKHSKSRFCPDCGTEMVESMKVRHEERVKKFDDADLINRPIGMY